MTLAKSAGALRIRRALATSRRQLALKAQLLRASEQKLADQQRHMASIAHDLRSPLQTINVALQLLSADVAPAADKPLRLAKASLARASGLLYDLLDFSALAHGEGIPLQRQREPLCELVQRALDDARLRFPGRGLTEALPEQEIWVEVDARRMAQVLDNLISNALLHGAHDTPVSVQVERAGDEVALYVQNAGTISDAARAKLFQPLSHGEGALRRGSMGLGLYIVKQLVEAHGGRIELSSGADCTTFSVRLPSLA